MSFYRTMKQIVDRHGAINNRYLSKFSKGQISDVELKRFAAEFYQFSRNFPAILATLLVNTADEKEAAELTNVLTSELGDGNPAKRHELLFRKFLRSIEIDPVSIMWKPILPTTKAFIDGMSRLYSSRDHFVALGASFGLENMAISMWDQLIPGLKTLKRQSFPSMDIEYFTFHRELEERHEDAMETALSLYENDPSIQKSFQAGAKKVLDRLEGFWMGLNARRDDKRW